MLEEAKAHLQKCSPKVLVSFIAERLGETLTAQDHFDLLRIELEQKVDRLREDVFVAHYETKRLGQEFESTRAVGNRLLRAAQHWRALQAELARVERDLARHIETGVER